MPYIKSYIVYLFLSNLSFQSHILFWTISCLQNYKRQAVVALGLFVRMAKHRHVTEDTNTAPLLINLWNVANKDSVLDKELMVRSYTCDLLFTYYGSGVVYEFKLQICFIHTTKPMHHQKMHSELLSKGHFMQGPYKGQNTGFKCACPFIFEAVL